MFPLFWHAYFCRSEILTLHSVCVCVCARARACVRVSKTNNGFDVKYIDFLENPMHLNNDCLN